MLSEVNRITIFNDGSNRPCWYAQTLMTGCKRYFILTAAFVLLVSVPVFGQTNSLTLSSGSTGLGGTVSLNLNFTVPAGANPPVALQWKMSYSAGTVASIGVTNGAALANAGKSVLCNSGSGSLVCVVYGMNSSTISSGTVAQVNVTLPSTISGSSVSILAGSAVEAFADGTGASIQATGGTITVLASQLSNPMPSITSLSPASVTVGAVAVALTVNGSGFVNGSVVQWNGSNRTTTYVSTGQLQASITAADVAAAGTAQVTVFTATPGGGTSGNSAFTINNPVPTITSLSPTSATMGGAAFTLTVNGSGFVNGSVVRWNGSNRTTTYVSAGQVQASITATDVAAAATAQVTVFNPTPAGGISGNVAFTINSSNPKPSITSLSPASIKAGAGAFTLTVNGSGFINGSVVKWNGSNRTTAYVSAGQLKASITATDVATGSTAQVTVFTPTPGGGTSGNSPFTINNPVPTITSLSPTSATVGGAAFTLTVNGSGFVTGSVVVWKGSNRTTVYVNAGQLKASIGALDIAASATAQIAVFNPAPGGGGSAATSFIVSPSKHPKSITTVTPSSVVTNGASTPHAPLSNPVPSDPRSGIREFPVAGDSSLAINSAHKGNFTRGQTGAAYIINVSNPGAEPISNTVTVTDALPAGLIATAINGPGWTCTQPSGPCTRNDVLEAGASYPFISLTVNVEPTAPPRLTNRVTVTGADSTSASGTDFTTVLSPEISRPEPVSSNPAAGSGNTTFAFTFSDPRGWQDLGVVNILINDGPDARNACSLAYSKPLNILYLVSDEGGTFLPGATLASSGGISNSQCTVGWGNSPVNGNGNTLVLNLDIGFHAMFAGNKVIYLSAGDVAGHNSGWEALGVWQVPGAVETTTTAMRMNPAQGSGTDQSYTFTFSDALGIQNLGVANILINHSLDGRHACYLAFARAANVLYLVNDAGDTWLPGKSLNAEGSLSNSQCAVSWDRGPVVAADNDLALSLNISFSPAFGGGRVFYLAARDANGENNTGWQSMAAWSIQ
jgi:hypothetical protein